MNHHIPKTREMMEKYSGFTDSRGNIKFSMNARKRYSKEQEEKQKKKDAEEKRRADAKAQRDRNSAGVASNKQAIAQKAPAPKPKGDQQIDPVKASPGVSAARQVVNSYQSGLSGGKSPWEQANEMANSSAGTSQFTPKQGSDLPDGMAKKDPQAFADKYKLNLINSGATK